MASQGTGQDQQAFVIGGNAEASGAVFALN
jgi:hypothetical protein